MNVLSPPGSEEIESWVTQIDNWNIYILPLTGHFLTTDTYILLDKEDDIIFLHFFNIMIVKFKKNTLDLNDLNIAWST